MQNHDGKRRLPVIRRGQRVPNLYTRPKSPSDRREGDTFEVIFRDDTGRQRQRTLRARSLRQAIEEAEEYRADLRRGDALPPSRLTFDEVAEEFFNVMDGLVVSGDRSSRTRDLYRQRYRSHIKVALGRRRIREIRAEHIGTVFSRQRRSGLSAWTISGTQTVISAMLSFAVSRGYISANPLSRLARMEKPSQITSREPRRLSDAEIRRLCDCATPTYRPIVATLAWTGLRVSEALALRWEDIDFERKEIRVQFQLDEDGDFKRPKTKAGRRSIPLLPVVEEALREHRRNQLGRGLAGTEQLAFTSARGKPLDRHNVRNRGIVPAARKAGLESEGRPTVTTHDLRRTFISHLILGLGLDPVRVAKIAGHASVSMTLDTYAEEFDKAMHRDDLMSRIEGAGFGAV
jgi:integrase